MPTELIKVATAGNVTADNVEALARQLTITTGISCVVRRLQYGRGLADDVDPATDRLTLVFASAPVEATVDATIAAHPALTIVPDGTAIAVTSGVPILLGEFVIEQGEIIVYDVHIFGALGSQADMQPVYVDAYPIAYRRTAGNVLLEQPVFTNVGKIPGFDLVLTATATTVRISIVMRKPGTFTLLGSSITVEEQGRIP